MVVEEEVVGSKERSGGETEEILIMLLHKIISNGTQIRRICSSRCSNNKRIRNADAVASISDRSCCGSTTVEE